MVERGEFREDLFYRLHIIPIEVPPLRERKEDILPLVTHFIHTITTEMAKPIAGITDEAMELLMRYDWPGNIRELENMIERAIVLCEGERLDAQLFPINERKGPRSNSATTLNVPPAGAITLDNALESIERAMIEDALEKSGGVKTKTAELLGIKTSALYYKLEKYGLTSG
jgi:two-component system response regulator HydG